MKAMARQRSHSIEFKRQVAREFIAGESLYALSKRHDISRQLIRVWVQKYEAGALDEDAHNLKSLPAGFPTRTENFYAAYVSISHFLSHGNFDLSAAITAVVASHC